MLATLHNLDDLRSLREKVQRKADIRAKVSERNKVPTLDEIRNASNIMFAKDDCGIVLAVSKGYQTLTGISTQSYEGMTDCDLWGDDGERFAENDAYVRMTGAPLQVVEFWFNAKEGMPQEGEILKVPYKYMDNGVERVGTLGRVLRDTLKFLTMEEYKARQHGDR
jgi:PAS domain-containing protein